ncbi:hypothetical protein [Radiobacillus sp. PE A8.2]|uniref:hypothetical protein n=1 Tax=Radiobacillus sp. PE A8.2 TaxID=3380349 RepID=UPI00388F6D3D
MNHLIVIAPYERIIASQRQTIAPNRIPIAPQQLVIAPGLREFSLLTRSAGTSHPECCYYSSKKQDAYQW